MSSRFKDYYVLAKPGIIYGNLLMAVAGFFFASHWASGYGTLVAMVIGLGLIIGAGCTVNNIYDRDIDSKMKRTKNRPTVTGKISKRDALSYALILAVIGSIILVVFVNGLSLIIAWFGLVVYTCLYTPAKHRSIYATLIGGFSGSVPLLVGYVAYANAIDLGGILLFFMLFAWQLTHFYAIALYRKEEYKAAKIPVWPLVKGNANTQLQALGYIGAFTVLAIGLFIAGYGGYVFLLLVAALGLGWFVYSLKLLPKLTAAAWGKKVFISSLSILLALAAILAIGPLLP